MRIHRRIDQIVADPATADAVYVHVSGPVFITTICRRLTPQCSSGRHHGAGITQISTKGPVFDGKEYPLDLLVYATGFEVQQTGIYNDIVGEGGVNLQDKYA